MRTYQILNDKGQVLNYYKTLWQAQSYVVKNYEYTLFIRSLIGQYFGEGYHTHIWTYNHSKLKFNRKNMDNDDYLIEIINDLNNEDLTDNESVYTLILNREIDDFKTLLKGVLS